MTDHSDDHLERGTRELWRERELPQGRENDRAAVLAAARERCARKEQKPRDRPRTARIVLLGGFGSAIAATLLLFFARTDTPKGAVRGGITPSPTPVAAAVSPIDQIDTRIDDMRHILERDTPSWRDERPDPDRGMALLRRTRTLITRIEGTS